LPKGRKAERTLISIVDDDQPFRDSLRELLRSLGYAVEVFASAADFLGSRLLPKTDCLLADVQMPEMSGIELHRYLVEARSPIPTILVTAYPNEADESRALQDGVICYLCKPVDDDHLERCLRSALRRGKPSQANS
jgi:FixJ family two-component response regulator